MSIGDQDKVLNMLVGDTQRIWIYADRGFAAPEPLPVDVTPAYARLVQGGYPPDADSLVEPSAG